MKSSSKNLILSAACGIDPNSLNFFLKTLRNFYNGEVLFLINPNDTELKKKLDFYNCKYLEINDDPKKNSLIIALSGYGSAKYIC